MCCTAGGPSPSAISATLWWQVPRVPTTSVLGGGGGTTQIILCSLVEENFKGEKNMSTLCNKSARCYAILLLLNKS